MTLMEWNPDWDTGAAEADRQRRELFAQLPPLEAAIAGGRGAMQALEALLHLADYVNCTIRAEERLMAGTGDPGRDGHRAAHAEIQTRVAAAALRHLTGTPDVSMDVVQLLLDWRRDHLDNWDRELGVHLRHAPARTVRAG